MRGGLKRVRGETQTGEGGGTQTGEGETQTGEGGETQTGEGGRLKRVKGGDSNR